MRKIVYNLLTLALFPLFAAYALTQPKIRRNFRDRLYGRPKQDDLDGALWIHAASIGEVVIAQNLLSYLRAKIPGSRYVVTTNTDYARELAASRLSGVPAYALPFDLAFSVRRFLGPSRPLALVIVETEIWPNLIWRAKRQGVPVFIVNGRISDSTLRTYRSLSFFFGPVLSCLDLIMAQSDEHAARFRSLSVQGRKVLSTGNIKFFRDVDGRGAKPIGTRRAIAFGSIREKEFETVQMIVRRLLADFPGYTFYLTPRELHLASSLVAALAREFPVATLSRIRDNTTNPAPVVVVDTVGDLMDIYRKSGLAFVGGSLAPYGGQNVLEPLFFGTPVLFGPHVENFREIADDILKEGAGIQVKDGDELLRTMENLLGDTDRREAMGAAGRGLIDRHKKAMERTAEVLLSRLVAVKPAARRNGRV